MHSPKWKRANAIARYKLFICLCQDDQDKVLKDKRALNVQTKIKARYSKVYTAYAMALVQELVTFKMPEEWTI